MGGTLFVGYVAEFDPFVAHLPPVWLTAKFDRTCELPGQIEEKKKEACRHYGLSYVDTDIYLPPDCAVTN